MNCNINYACTNLLSAGVMNSYIEVLPTELATLRENLKKSGAHLDSDALFTVFWDYTDRYYLPLWVTFNDEVRSPYRIGYRFGDIRAGYISFNNTLKMGLDVNSSVNNEEYTNLFIQNISMINSNESPDGIYRVYLNNLWGSPIPPVPFNFVFLYKPEIGGEFTKYIWLKGSIKERPFGVLEEIHRMQNILNLRKRGREFTVEKIPEHMQVVLQNQF